jgi:hypothetical protein
MLGAQQIHFRFLACVQRPPGRQGCDCSARTSCPAMLSQPPDTVDVNGSHQFLRRLAMLDV